MVATMLHRARAARASLTSCAVLALGLWLAACGGGKGSATPRATGDVPFDQEAVKALMAATKVADLDGCTSEGAVTIADTMRAQRGLLAADGSVDEAFHCAKSALADDTWECTWEVSRAPAGGEDDEGSAFQAIARVDSDGVLRPGQLLCVAPG
jgi:hypothetical protein